MLKQTDNTSLSVTQDNNEAKAVLELAREAHEKYLIKFHKEDLDKAIEYYINTIKLDPNVAETYYRLASLLWENGQITLTAAIEQCQSAVSISPKNPNARLYTGYFLNLAQDFEAAEKEFKAAIDINPLMAARPRIMLAMLLINKIKASKPNLIEVSKTAYYLLTGCMTILWDYPSVRMLYNNGKENFMVTMYKLCGCLLEKTNHAQLAIKTYDIAAEKTGKEELFFKKIGDLSIENEAPEIALDSYYRALSANPYNRDVLVKLATVLQTYFEDRVDDAIDCYSRLLEIEGRNDRVYYELGHLYLKKNDTLNSVNAFKLAIEIAKENPFYHNSLAYALVQAEQFDEAIEHYQIAININPDNEWTAIVCQALGTLYYKVKENIEAAIALYQTALVLDPNCDEAHVCIGDIYFENEDIDSAIKAYCDAITINPESARAYNKCAMALWENDYAEEAILAYNKAIDLMPEYEIAYNNLGVIYLDSVGNTTEASILFERAIDLNPNYTLAYFNLARAQQILGKKMESAKNFQMASDLNKITCDIDEKDIKERLFSLFEV